MKKKLIKAGIASAMICTVLGSTVVPTSAKEVPVDTAKEVTKIAEEVTPRFMYTQTRTVTSPEFDTIVTIDTVQTSSTWSSTYSYYDNYQGVNIKLEFNYLYGGRLHTGTRTVKVHI